MTLTLEKLHDFRIPSNIRFYLGAVATLPEEIVKLSPSKIVLISDNGIRKSGLVDQVSELIKTTSISASIYTDIDGEPTIETVEKAVTFIKEKKCDLVIGLGGGSALDVAKAAAAMGDKEKITDYLTGERILEQRSISCILLPTTSGTGAEVTMNAIFGDNVQEVKKGIVSPVLLPDLAIVDPELTMSCPPRVTAASGVDAFTHAIESFIAVRATAITRIYSEQAMKLFAPNIAKTVHFGNDVESRVNMSWVSLLAGVSLANAGVGAVHALAYPLGGKFHIEHGIANALLMPYVFQVIGKTRLEDMVEVANFIGLGNFKNKPHLVLKEIVNYMYSLLVDLDLPKSLEELGVDRKALPRLAKEASLIDRLLLNTPYRLNEKKILRIYEQAYQGEVQ